MLVKFWQSISNLLSNFGGLLIAAIIGAIPSYFLGRLQERNKEKEKKLKIHFDEVLTAVIEPMLNIIKGIKVENSFIMLAQQEPGNYPSVVSFPDFPFFERDEQFEAFKVHYPQISKKWQDFKYEIQRHNEKVNIFQNDIGKFITTATDLPLGNLNYTDEMIISQVVSILAETLYKSSIDKHPVYNFHNLRIEPIEKMYALKFDNITIGISQVALTNTSQKAERCKEVFVSVQESEQFKNRALEINFYATDIPLAFLLLSEELERIKTKAFLTKNRDYKFQAQRKCSTCKEYSIR